MIDLKLKASHDLEIASGDIVLVEDGAEVAQSFSIRVKTRQGEFKMDVMAGIDMEELFSASTSMAHKEAILRKAVYDTYGVNQILKFDLYTVKTDMKLYVDMVVSTIYAENEIINLVI